jgi:DNA-binding NarL/FixJ family response regulator
METSPTKINVLIADDSEKVRRRLRSMLSGFSEEAIADNTIADVGNGVDRVLDSIGRFSPSIVIVDIQIKDGRGIDLLRQIQKDYPNTEIIVLTNKADRFYRRACLQAGARYFLDKTIEIERVKDAVARLRSDGRS